MLSRQGDFLAFHFNAKGIWWYNKYVLAPSRRIWMTNRNRTDHVQDNVMSILRNSNFFPSCSLCSIQSSLFIFPTPSNALPVSWIISSKKYVFNLARFAAMKWNYDYLKRCSAHRSSLNGCELSGAGSIHLWIFTPDYWESRLGMCEASGVCSSELLCGPICFV